MGILFGIKIILDCFFNLDFQDILIGMNFLTILIYIMVSEKSKHYRLYRSGTILVLALIFLFGNSMLQNPTAEAIRNYVKFLTSALLFYIGSVWGSSATDQSVNRFVTNILWGYHIAFLYNLLMVFWGPGRIQWGLAQTIRGSFYYKTDYAMFLLQYIVFLRYYISSHNKNLKLLGYSLIVGSSILIVFTNARIALLSLLMLYTLMWAERKKTKLKSLINVKSVLLVLPVIGITVIAILIVLPLVFPNRNMLGIRLNESLLSNANTQGRISAWNNILSYFLYEASPLQQLFGIDLVSTSILAEPIPDAHSLYIYCLFSIGLAGLFLFLYSTYYLLCKIKNHYDEKLAYTTLNLLMIMLTFGISQDVIIFTQHMWLMFFFYGLICGTEGRNITLTKNRMNGEQLI